MKTLLIPAAFLAGSPALAASVPLASTMDPAGTVSENALTGETFIISNGDGTVANGLAGDDDSSPAFGSLVNLFPREADFVVGSLDFDTGSITAVGSETSEITAIDLSELWTADPNRTTSDPTADATVLSDISDFAIGAWLFNGPGSITFGPLDASDTVTFTDGLLTSIDFSIDASFNADAFGTPVMWTGTLAAAGDTLSFQINDTQPAGFGNSTLVVDLTGTIAAVGSSAIPEPTAAVLLSLAVTGLVCSRKR
mgnify:CR=1 FL=1